MAKKRTFCVTVESTAKIGPFALVIEADDSVDAYIKADNVRMEMLKQFSSVPWKPSITVGEAVVVDPITNKIVVEGE